MKIHLIANSYSDRTGGAERLVRQLHLNFLKKGHDSYVLGLESQVDPELENSLSIGASSPYHLKVFWALWKYCKRNIADKDIVHVHLFPSNLYCSILKKIGVLKGTLITTEHNTFNSRRNKRWGRIIDRFLYSTYDQIVAISEGTRVATIKWIQELESKVKVINNGCELYFQQVMERNKGNGEIINLLSVGSLSEQKNYFNCLKAVKILEKENIHWRIAGSGKLLEELESFKEKLGINDKVTFLGRVDPIYDLLIDADIFLMPSKWEGFGLAAVEAMNASLPLITSNVLGLQEVVSGQSKCSISVDPDKPIAIAEGLKVLMKDRALRRQYGINGFKRANAFDVSVMVDAYLKLFSEFSIARLQEK